MEKLGVAGTQQNHEELEVTRTQQDEGNGGARPQVRRRSKESGGDSSSEDGSNNGFNKELNSYDPRCGMSKEEFEWRCAHQKRVSQRMPQALHKLNICSERMRHHFLDDPDALEKWDEYANDVYDSFEDNLQYSLSSPSKPPDSICYRHIMKSKSCSKTSFGMLHEGMVKLRHAAGNRSIVVAGAIMTLGTAAGLAVNQWKKQRVTET